MLIVAGVSATRPFLSIAGSTMTAPRLALPNPLARVRAGETGQVGIEKVVDSAQYVVLFLPFYRCLADRSPVTPFSPLQESYGDQLCRTPRRLRDLPSPPLDLIPLAIHPPYRLRRVPRPRADAIPVREYQGRRAESAPVHRDGK